MRKMVSDGPSQNINLGAAYPTITALKEDRCILHNNVDHDLRYAIMTGLDHDVTVRHVMAIPLHDCNNELRGMAEFTRNSNFPVPFPEDLFHTAAEDITSFAHMIWRGADYRREMNIYRILGKRFPELFLKPTNWDHVIYRYMVLIKTQINPERVHLFRVNNERTEASASVFDTGRYSKKGYLFDYSKEVNLPVAATFLREFIHQKSLLNLKQSTHAWIAGRPKLTRILSHIHVHILLVTASNKKQFSVGLEGPREAERLSSLCVHSQRHQPPVEPVDSTGLRELAVKSRAFAT